MFDWFVQVDWVGQAKGLALPAAYIVVLMGLLVTFSSLYRKRQAAKAASLEPWFPRHVARDVYLSLLHLEQTEPGKEKPVTVPDSILKAALLRRAVEDIHRIVSLRSSKNALQILLQRGSVGDDLWQRFQRAEQEINEEAQDVVNEANALAAGWGQTIFQSANEMAQNAKLRERIGEVQGTVAEEKKWYAAKRDASAKELLEASSSSSGSSDSSSDDNDDGDADADAGNHQKSASGSSEGEGVLVQAPVTAEDAEKVVASAVQNAAAGGGGGGGKSKKRKGKGKK